MTTTDTAELGLEERICTALTGHPRDPSKSLMVVERPPVYGPGWLGGFPNMAANLVVS